jgi:hypothetical protein
MKFKLFIQIQTNNLTAFEHLEVIKTMCTNYLYKPKIIIHQLIIQ